MSFVHNQPEYSVSEIAGHVKRMVEETFGFVRVRGEISKASVNAGSGHCYLSLKDERAVLDAVIWKGTMSKLAHKPQGGMEVIATGKLTTYPGSSKYQLVIDSLEPAGIGALMAMLEERKKMLAAEGLFATERKRQLPFMPRVIGVVTSPTGAVIRDILHRIADRFPSHVIVWAVPVQGQDAAEKIAAAIAGFNAIPLGSSRRPDVIIVARGGGSIEDLWAFNEEIVVRAAANSAIPLISAVGHETDTTLIDFAADMRAPTPTAAAEIAVPVHADYVHHFEQRGLRMQVAVVKQLRHGMEQVRSLARGLPRPQQLVATMEQTLDGLVERLQLALPRSLQQRQEKVQRLAAGMSPRLLREMVLRQEQRVQHVGAMLESLNVLAVLKRGFALVKDDAGKVIQSAAVMPNEGRFYLQFHDGERLVAAMNAAAPAAAKPRTKNAAPQPGLFDDQ